MFLRPILICAAGVFTLQLLTVRADSTIPLEIPKGWSASISIGKQYFVGYDSREKAYFIRNMEPIGPTGRVINADTSPSPGGHQVPYSATGLQASDLWAASLLQSVEGTPYQNHKVKFTAELKAQNFKGKFDILLRAVSSDGKSQTSSSSGIDWPDNKEGWQTFSVEIERIPEGTFDKFDPGSLYYGFLIQGTGKVLMRNATLVDEEIKPTTQRETRLQEIFGAPPAIERPVNLEMRR